MSSDAAVKSFVQHLDLYWLSHLEKVKDHHHELAIGKLPFYFDDTVSVGLKTKVNQKLHVNFIH